MGLNNSTNIVVFFFATFDYLNLCLATGISLDVSSYNFNEIAPPSTGLYFILNGVTYLPGNSVLISDIGPQPADRSDRGTTLVCVTTNINTACCRSSDNNGLTNATAGAVGEWYYPNSAQVPRPDGNVVDFARIGFTHQVRLGREVSDSIPPLGVYTCQVTDPSTGFVYNASITIHQERSQ